MTSQQLNTMTIEAKAALVMENNLSNSLGVDVTSYVRYVGSYVFNVPTELDAYKTAYRFQHEKAVSISQEPQMGKWSVRIYEK